MAMLPLSQRPRADPPPSPPPSQFPAAAVPDRRVAAKATRPDAARTSMNPRARPTLLRTQELKKRAVWYFQEAAHGLAHEPGHQSAVTHLAGTPRLGANLGTRWHRGAKQKIDGMRSEECSEGRVA